MSIDEGRLSASEAAQAVETAVANDDSYIARRMRTQLEEELRAADQYVTWERSQVRLFLPGATTEALLHVDCYAQAIARQILCRRALETAFPKP